MHHRENLVTVLMSVYDENNDILRQSIESIINQTYNRIEFLIILDNPSNNKARELLNRYALADKRIKLIINKSNLGLVNSLNIGLKNANGCYIARMDADDIAEINRLKRQVNYIESKNLDIIGSAIQKIDETGKYLGKAIIYPQNHYLIKYLLRTKSCIAHPTWLVKREVMLSLNGYRNIQACEDYDVLLRAKELGYKFGNIKKIGLYYRKSKVSISKKYREIQVLNTDIVRKNKNISEKDIMEYTKSKKGKRHLNNIKKYFLYLEKYKISKKNHQFILALTYLLKSIFFTNRAKVVLLNAIIVPILSKAENFLIRDNKKIFNEREI